MKKRVIFLSVIKHLILFAFINFLGAVMLLVLVGNFFNFSSVVFIKGVIFVGMYGMALTIIPYMVAILIIKKMKDPTVWAYVLGGMVSPFILYCLFLSRGISMSSTAFILIFMLIGALGGVVYRVFDNRNQISLKPTIQGESDV